MTFRSVLDPPHLFGIRAVALAGVAATGALFVVRGMDMIVGPGLQRRPDVFYVVARYFGIARRGLLVLPRMFLFFHTMLCQGSANAVPEGSGAFPIFIQTTAMDQSAYLDLLSRTEQETLAIVARMDEEALRQHAEGQWSPLQVLEHCCLTEALVQGLLQRPSAEQHETDTVHGSDKLYHLMVNKRNIKIQAPERLHPKGAFAGRADFEERFRTQRASLRDALEGGTLPLDNRLYPHPVLGNMTASDWLYFLVHHTQRHLEELKERIPATV